MEQLCKSIKNKKQMNQAKSDLLQKATAWQKARTMQEQNRSVMGKGKIVRNKDGAVVAKCELCMYLSRQFVASITHTSVCGNSSVL
jgi:hypothetical protein